MIEATSVPQQNKKEKEKILVIQLISSESILWTVIIIGCCTVKRWLITVLIQEELDDIIRYGSKELFADENDEAGKLRQIHYDDAAIDR